MGDRRLKGKGDGAQIGDKGGTHVEEPRDERRDLCRGCGTKKPVAVVLLDVRDEGRVRGGEGDIGEFGDDEVRCHVKVELKGGEELCARHRLQYRLQ